MGDLHHLALGVAVHEQIGLRIEQHRATHAVRPVIEMRHPSQRRLDAADNHGHVLPGFACTLGVNDHRAIGAASGGGVRRVGIVRTDATVGRVAVDHRIHIAGGDAEKKLRPAQRPKGLGGRPVRLGDNTDAKTLRLQHASDQRHAETRMIDIGIARDQDHVTLVPAEAVHFGARHGQHRRRRQPRGPVLAVRKNVACRVHVRSITHPVKGITVDFISTFLVCGLYSADAPHRAGSAGLPDPPRRLTPDHGTESILLPGTCHWTSPCHR